MINISSRLISLMRITAIENKLQSFLFKDCLINLICLLLIFRFFDLVGFWICFSFEIFLFVWIFYEMSSEWSWDDWFLFFVFLSEVINQCVKEWIKSSKKMMILVWMVLIGLWMMFECDLSILNKSVLFMTFDKKELIQETL